MDKETAKKFVLDIPNSDKKVKTLSLENIVEIADWVYDKLEL